MTRNLFTKIFTNKKGITAILILLLYSIINSGLANNVNKTQTPAPPKESPQKQVLPAQTTQILPEPSSGINNREQAILLRVVDGDTIKVSLNGKNETIRIIGINAPESVDPRKPVECMGKEASNQAKQFFEKTDKKLWLEKDPSQSNRDKYDRLLRYVFTANGTTDFGKSMISLGFAYEYTYDNPYKYQKIYKQTEREAQDAKKGLWAENACIRSTK